MRSTFLRSVSFVFVSCVLCSSLVHSGNDAFSDERAALLELYQATNGPGWLHQDGWNGQASLADDNNNNNSNNNNNNSSSSATTPSSDSSVCGWYGVSCWNVGDARDGLVRSLHLTNNHLVGTWPDESMYSQLHHWTSVDVSDNPQLHMTFANLRSSVHLHLINLANTQVDSWVGLDDAPVALHHLFADRVVYNPKNTTATTTTTASSSSSPLPSQLWQLSQLQTLSLAEGSWTGPIPSDFIQLTSLQALYLHDNLLSGTVPTDILARLTNLQLVSLAQNRFTGTLNDSQDNSWEDALTELRAFSVFDQLSKTTTTTTSSSNTSSRGLTGPLPSFANSPNLTNLHLGSNAFTGSIPIDFLSSVSADAALLVDVSHNQLTGSVSAEALGQFSRLDIDVQDNRITNVDRSLCHSHQYYGWLGGAVEAYGCYAILCPPHTAGGRQQFDNEPCQVCSETDLAATNTSNSNHWYGQETCPSSVNNNNNNNSPTTVPTTPNSTTTTTDIAFNMTQVEILQLLYDQCGGVNWRTSTNWNNRNTSICNWYGVTCDDTTMEVATGEHLVVELSLGANQLAGEVPMEVFRLPGLKRLALYSNPITIDFTQGLASLAQATQLHSLVLDETRLESLDGLDQAATALREIKARYCQLSGRIPTVLSKLTNLQSLSLSHNALTGPMPTWLGRLTQLQTLLLSQNDLTGPVYDFHSLANLTYLDLSRNRLSGTFPAATLLQSVSSQETVTVDVSSNQISGKLDASALLSRFTWLSLYLQDNLIWALDNANVCRRQDASTSSSSVTNNWNHGDVANFGCNGLLCPLGTSNALGRQTSPDTPCVACDKALYMGSTACSSSNTAWAQSGSVSRRYTTTTTTTARWWWTTTTAFVVVVIVAMSSLG